jgi:FADH2 O2-dependent halogenase
MALEEVENPGLHWSDHVGYADLFNDMVDQCQAYDAGEITGAQAADALYNHLERAPFVPRHWGWTERELRFINPTLPRISRTMWWALRQAPPDVRRIMLGFIRESGREYLRGRRVL